MPESGPPVSWVWRQQFFALGGQALLQKLRVPHQIREEHYASFSK
jgi:hypothetical protein